ncbi:MAG: bifunctional riboflavin kinase/FAD synthetase, partial [Candidatus Aminicenantes bacterium]|nr:bifunctional riboflavin kinase/FAD synthetase [Candidatus Aminicenantes bacterium]
HLINFDKEIYDKYVEIHFLKFIRGERKFSSEKELIFQIRDDVNTIKFDFETEV